jgi:hypothetical protein
VPIVCNGDATLVGGIDVTLLARWVVCSAGAPCVMERRRCGTEVRGRFLRRSQRPAARPSLVRGTAIARGSFEPEGMR